MSKPDNNTIGLIGIGLLGSALAERMVGAGFELVGFDTDTARVEQLESIGGTAAGSAAEVAAKCNRILLSLPDSSAVATVIDQVAEHLRPGQILIDTTTGSPEASIAAAKRAGEHGATFLDATVAGSSEQARHGVVLVMAGGPTKEFESCSDIFAAFASRCFHVGKTGDGAKMKLVANLAIGLHRAVLAEALCFGESLGFDPAAVLHILTASPAYSRAMDTKGDKMVQRDFAPQARLAQHAKDVGLILELANESGAKTPLSEWHAATLKSLIDNGYGNDDNSVVMRAFETDHNEKKK